MIRIYFLLLFLLSVIGFSQPFNNVALLSGQDDFIEIPSNFTSSFTSDVTIEAWIKPCQINGHRMIVTKFYCIGNNNQFYFTILNGKLRWAWDNTGCADGANFYETGVIIQANIWQHVAVRHTASGVTIYLNGMPVAGSLIQGAFSTMLFSNEPLRIGVYKTITSNWFGSYSGLVDEVRIWDYAVSDADILSRYQAPLVGNEVGLAGYYNMDISGTGAGVIVPNSSTSLNGGTVDGVAMGTLNTPAFLNSASSLSNQLFGNDTLICAGETLLLDASSFTGSYVWQDGSTDSVFSVTQAGLYHVLISNSCEVFSDSIQVGFAPPPVFTLGNDTLLCQGEVLQLSIENVPNATGYLWQDGSIDSVLTINQAGTYTATVNVDACQSSDSIVVSYSGLWLDLGPDSVLCEDEFLYFNLTQPGASYSWQDGFPGSEYYILDSGLYIATVSDAACQLVDSIYVNINTVEANFTFETSPACGSSPVEYANESVVNIGYISNLKWNIDGDQTFATANPTQFVSTSKTQKVELIVTTNHGCVDEKIIYVPVEVYDVPSVNFIASNFKPNAGETVVFENTSDGGNSYLWTIDSTYTTDSISPSYIFSDEGIYKVGLTGYTDLCSTLVYKFIIVDPPLYYYVPNAFSPNGNSRNEVFMPVFTPEYTPADFQLTIFNRWGEIMFISKDSNVGWNGLYANEHVQAGAYTWKIEFLKFESSERITDYGTITIVY